ncbi:MAG TPA: NAD(P)-dependent oxidoreductase, partial [Elusimicrobiota bacterium]|nr:NAD(P)-dependent oxidoreductase [Elusimicrobiota bacterium]
MLALRRNLPAYQEAVRAGRWQHSPVPSLSERPVYDLKGAVLGLIGYGELARRVDVLARAFGMTVCVAERKGSTVIRPGRAAFERVLRKSDIVSLHCPLTPETRGMIGRAEIAMMKRGAILINTARGPVIDDAAVADALRSAQLGGAGVDVLTEEPPRSGNPLLDPGLPNVIVTPHIAWTSQAALAALADIVIANMESFVKGEPKNIVS